MRFILKSAFWLGLVAFLLPGSGNGETEDAAVEISWFTALVGAEQALEDVTGFCGRAPAACDAGREILAFAGERIGDGVVLAYRLVDGRLGEEADALTDPILTGAVDEVAVVDPAGKSAPVSPAVPAISADAGTEAAEAEAAPAPAPFRAPVPMPAPRA